MSQVYVVLKKVFSQVALVPSYEIVDQPPAELDFGQKLATLEPGEYIDAAKCEISKDLSELRVNTYRIINDSGKAKEEFVESYSFERDYL